MKIKAKITDIQTNKEKGASIVGVEIIRGGKKYRKAFKVDVTKKVSFNDFKDRLMEMVNDDLSKEKNIEDNIIELEKHKGIQFNLKDNKEVNK